LANPQRILGSKASTGFKDSQRFPRGQRPNLLVMTTTARKIVLAAAGAVLALGVAAGLALSLHTGTAQAAAARMYGDPAAAASYWRMQSLDDCGLMAAADVIGQLTKRDVSEREIVAVAQQLPSRTHRGPMYTLPKDTGDPNSTGYGTDPADLPVLLAQYRITATFVSTDDDTGAGTGLAALEGYLAAGHKVIAGVNAELLWGIAVQTRDRNGNPTADHAVVVTGVDTATGKVHLNDSGNPNGRDETVAIDVFAKSWAASGDQVIVTEQTS
jgi:uncharacterized protein YvpB